jgi:hypothetical protein
MWLWSRERNEKVRTTIAAAITAVGIALVSAILFSDGVWHVALVWGQNVILLIDLGTKA